MSPMLDAPPSVVEAGRRIRAGELTATGLLESVVDRLRATEPAARAWADLGLDEAYQAARAADRTRPTLPLHGIPFGVKDVFEVRGRVTTCGRAHGPAPVGLRDARVVASLRAAGAIVVGMQVTHELTCGVDEPPTRNPERPGHYAGGSSVGSAVSVACGSSYFSVGTDAAGSVRIPASANGVFGLKPTRGLLSTEGVVRSATAPTLDNVGLLAGSAEDLGLVLDAVAPRPARQPVRLGSARIGVVVNRGRLEDPAVTTALEGALTDLAAAGAAVLPVRLAELRQAAAVTGTLFVAELADANHQAVAESPGAFHPEVAAVVRRGLAVSRQDRAAAHFARRRMAAFVEGLFRTERLDAVLLPTMPILPPLLAELDPAVDLARLTALTCAFNLSGHPAISLPAPSPAGAPPIGLQLVGRRNDDASLLRLAADFAALHRPTPHEK